MSVALKRGPEVMRHETMMPTLTSRTEKRSASVRLPDLISWKFVSLREGHSCLHGKSPSCSRAKKTKRRTLKIMVLCEWSVYGPLSMDGSPWLISHVYTYKSPRRKTALKAILWEGPICSFVIKANGRSSRTISKTTSGIDWP